MADGTLSSSDDSSESDEDAQEIATLKEQYRELYEKQHGSAPEQEGQLHDRGGEGEQALLSKGERGLRASLTPAAAPNVAASRASKASLSNPRKTEQRLRASARAHYTYRPNSSRRR